MAREKRQPLPVTALPVTHSLLQIQHDNLNLRQPVRITALSHVSSTNILAATQFGNLKRYDIRAARKPVADWSNILNETGRHAITALETGYAEQFVQSRLPIPQALTCCTAKRSSVITAIKWPRSIFEMGGYCIDMMVSYHITRTRPFTQISFIGRYIWHCVGYCTIAHDSCFYITGPLSTIS